MATSKIGIFGGAFDPIHCGHIEVAEHVAGELELDRIYLVPSGLHPFKGSAKISPADRLHMLELAIEPLPNFFIDTVELDSPDTAYTVDTLEYFHRRFPSAEMYFMLGMDNLRQFNRWKSPLRIIKLAKLVVFGRPNAGRVILPEAYFGRVHYAESPQIDVSSSEIKQLLAEGHSIEGLVPPAVWNYIENHGLYQPDSLTNPA